MRRINIIISIILIATFIIGLCGFTLVDSNIGEKEHEDRMIGVLVTTDSLDLFDHDKYIQDNLNKIIKNNRSNKIFRGEEMGVNSQYQGRMYATLEDEVLTNEETGKTVINQKYVFKDVEGFFIFCANMGNGERSSTVVSSDGAITDTKIKQSYGDEVDEIELKGTVNIMPNFYNIFFVNPVYQSESGDVYVMEGQGMSSNFDTAGMGFSQTLNQSITTTENGETKTETANIEIWVKVMNKPSNFEIVEFDKDNTIVASNNYTSGQLPEEIYLSKETEYIIVNAERKNTNEELLYKREIYQKEDESISTFYGRDDGICLKQYSKLIWGKD